MSPDQVSGTINRHLAKIHVIETPEQAFQEMSKARKKNKFISSRMNQADWRDWKKMQEQHTHVLGRKAYLPDGSRVEAHFLKSQQWRVSEEKPWSIFLKYTFSETEQWKELRVRKNSRTPLLPKHKMSKSWPEGRAINKKKFLDLQTFIPMLRKS
jgi:hypothetical protein